MSNIYFSSDLHLNHDREFIYAPRGFKNIYEMNDTIVNNFCKTVGWDDHLFLLGDLMLGDNSAISMLNQIPGHKHIIIGNHDTNNRIALYEEMYDTEVLGYADVLKHEGLTFYLSHYPTLTSNLEADARLYKHVTNLYGHTHQTTNFYNGMPYMYHVGVDSHNCMPVSIDKIIEDIQKEIKECYKQL